MLFANQRIRTPLTVGGEVAVFQVAASEALVASGVAVIEDGEGEARKAVHMHLIRGQPCGGADGIVVSKFHVRQVDVPVVLSFVDDHRQHLSHGVVDALDAIVAIGMVALVGIFRMPRSLYTASDSLKQNCSPLSERRLAGHPQGGMYSLTRMSAVPLAVNSAAETAYMSA